MVDGEIHGCVYNLYDLEDTLDRDGGKDLAAAVRIRSGFMRFREFRLFLRSPLEMKVEEYSMNSCVRNNISLAEQMQMIIQMCGASMKDRIGKEFRKLAEYEHITTVIRNSMLIWTCGDDML